MLLFNVIGFLMLLALINFNTSNVTIQQKERDIQLKQAIFQYI